MRYVWPEVEPSPDARLCRDYGHTYPRPQEFDRLRGVVKTRRFPLWRRILGVPQKCRRCGVRRYWK